MQILSLTTGSIGTNTYYVYDEETKQGFIVDPGGYSKTLSDKIKELGLTVEYIILTHGHADHIMGVGEFLRDFPQAKIVAGKDEERMLADKNFNMSEQFGCPTELTADISVSDDEEMTVGGMKLKFLFTPGHTPGGMCIYLPEEDTLFSGDTLFQNSIGRTDFPGCSYKDLVRSVHAKLWPLPDETNVFPGHMGPTNLGYEKQHNPFL